MQGLLNIQTDIRDMIAELSAWLRQPASAPSRPVAASGERQPAPLQPAAAVSPEGTVGLAVTPPTPRKRMEFRSARPLAEGEAPKDDGSKLPRPLHQNLKD